MTRARQPLCDPCWVHETAEWAETDDGEWVPVSYSIPATAPGYPLEVCCQCGTHTIAGIYVMRDTDNVPFPTIIPED